MANHNTHLDVSNYGAVLLTLAAACLLLRGTRRTRAMAGVLALLLVADRTLALPAAAALLAGAAAPTLSRRRPARLGAAIAVACLLALPPLVAWAPAAPLITACARAFGVVSVLPLIALLRPGACPRAAATLGWLLVPGWLAVHLVYWDVGEPRVWLLPTALVLLPAVMAVIAHAAPRTPHETAHA